MTFDLSEYFEFLDLADGVIPAESTFEVLADLFDIEEQEALDIMYIWSIE